MEDALQENDPPRIWISKYYGSFDGLRAVAILLVFWAHYAIIFTPGLPSRGAWVGVDIFFVLSGFLITGILFDSVESPHYFRNFYIRRALRIFPLPYVFFLFVLVLTPVLHLTYSPMIWTNTIYVSNWFVKGSILHHTGNPTIVSIQGHGARTITLGHLWSLCVEEQFYIVWPVLVWLLRTRRRLMWLCGALIPATVLLRTMLWMHSSPAEIETGYLYCWTYARCDTLLVGAWMALWLRGVKLSRHQLRRISEVVFCLSVGTLTALILLIDLPMRMLPNSPVIITVGYTLIAFAAGALILRSLDGESRLRWVLRRPWMAHLGRISYGFYFLHAMMEVFASRMSDMLQPFGLRWILLPLLFGCTYVAARISFRYLEAPFLKLKSVLAPDHRSIPSGTEEDVPPALAQAR